VTCVAVFAASESTRLLGYAFNDFYGSSLSFYWHDINFYAYSILSLKMINQLTSSFSKQGYWVLFIPEKVTLDNFMQNLLNLRMYYARRFLHLSLLLISI
jgi:hypothetical protein